ncbi:MAG: MerR family transcriptional regulator, partial [Microbacterium sp.]
MDWSIQEIARLAGTTSRTLRHYDDIGLLAPSRIAANGYRHYDGTALVRLQRILLLRELGLGLPQIGEVLGRAASEESALETHLSWLRQEQERLGRQIASVENTITALKKRGPLMAEDMLDGFDHTKYKDEVEERWGEKAYADGDRWWRGMTDAERTSWKQRVADLNGDWIALAATGADPAGAEAQDLARRH